LKPRPPAWLSTEDLRKSLFEQSGNFRMPAEVDERIPAIEVPVFMEGSHPIAPIGSEWDRFYDPERISRSYHFDSASSMRDFVSFVMDVLDTEVGGTWVDFHARVVPGSFTLDVDLHRGGGVLGDNEQLLSEILDEGFNSEPEFEGSIIPKHLLGTDDEFDFGYDLEYGDEDE
jgi:hypothetical protein